MSDSLFLIWLINPEAAYALIGLGLTFIAIRLLCDWYRERKDARRRREQR
jgi:hypothetical protein